MTTRDESPSPASVSAMAVISPAILLVDDLPQNLLALEAILEPLGTRLVRAGSGPDALKCLLTEDFAVILLDVQMPVMDGFETARLIKERERSRHIPIIFLTALSKDEEYVFRGYNVGAVDYISKPFDPDIMRAKVQVFLDLYTKTEQLKQKEQLLRKREVAEIRQASERRYRDLAESMPQVVWMADAKGALQYGNRRWFDTARLPIHAAGALDFDRVLHEADRARFHAEWKAGLESEHDWSGEFRFGSTANNIFRWHLVRVVPIRGEKERAVSWIGTSTDIDDRKRAEDKLRFLAEASSVLASTLDCRASFCKVAELAASKVADFCIVDVLEGAVGARSTPDPEGAGASKRPPALGLSRGSEYPAPIPTERGAPELERWCFVGPDRTHVPPESNEIYFEFADGAPYGPPKCLATQTSDLVSDVTDLVRVAIADGPLGLSRLRSMSTMSFASAPVVARGRTLGVVSFLACRPDRTYDQRDLELLEDLARRMAAAADVAALYDLAEAERVKLEKAHRAKDEFLATLSHELRTPLNAMLGWTQLLRAGDLEQAEFDRALETIERNAKAQAQLIADLLDVSRIVTGKLHLNVSRVQLPAVLEAAVDAVRLTAAAKGLELETSVDPFVREVEGDANRLLQVVANLLSNAVKFTPAKGKISVALEEQDGRAIIVVKDSGQGISPEFLPYVFDRFRQADSTSTRTQGGLGLGLAIVSHLVQLHRGRVTVASAGRDKGATFAVELPVITAVEPVAAVAGEIAERPGPRSQELSGLAVLLVEDEPDGRGMVRVVLERVGARVIAVATAQEAMAALDEEVPDVIVSDIGLPGEDGYTFIRRVRELDRKRCTHVLAVALTAYASEEDRTKAIRAGFDAHVAKPVEPLVLTQVVARLARTARAS